MGCNKNLTDDQFEAMFTATDEEMGRLSTQWNVWLKEPNSNETVFSNEAALKQHHCERQIKKEKSPHCRKTINRANNLG